MARRRSTGSVYRRRRSGINEKGNRLTGFYPGFYVRLRRNGREFKSYAGPDRQTALEVLARLVREQDRLALLDEEPQREIKFEDFTEVYLEWAERIHTKSTYDSQAHLRGKGNKERLCPIWPETARVLKLFLEEQALDSQSASAVFRNRRGEPLTRFGVRHLLSRLVDVAAPTTPSLARKRVHPHVIRHTTAVHLLQSGVDLVTISHWLGHASVETTNLYLAVDLAAKREALECAQPLVEMDTDLAGWRDDASILSWLESL